jgi:hypothetical protein
MTSQGMGAEPAIRLQILLARLTELCIPTRVPKFPRQDAISQKTEFSYQQITDARDIAELKHNIAISINTLVKTLDCPRSRLRLRFEHGLHPAGNRRKHTILDRDSEQHQLPDKTSIQFPDSVIPRHSPMIKELRLCQNPFLASFSVYFARKLHSSMKYRKVPRTF